MDELQKQKLELEIQEKELEAQEFVQSFSHGKKVLIGVLAILIIPAFFLSKFVTAQIYSYNTVKSEAHPAVITSLPVNVVEVEVLPISGNSYSAYALIKNPNRDLVATDLPYTFKFFDEKGSQIYSTSDKTFLLGGAQKYVILSNIRLNSKPGKVTIDVQNPTWKKRLSIPNVILQSSVPEFGNQQDPTGFFVTGEIVNTSVYTLGTVTISGVITDSKNDVIAVSQFKANAVESKEARSYRLFWPIELQAQMSGLPKIFVETNVLDPSNLR
jgi:hypothetical protein